MPTWIKRYRLFNLMVLQIIKATAGAELWNSLTVSVQDTVSIFIAGLKKTFVSSFVYSLYWVKEQIGLVK